MLASDLKRLELLSKPPLGVALCLSPLTFYFSQSKVYTLGVTGGNKIMTTTLASIKKVCRTCDGTGEVSRMEYVYPGEPHMADIGTAPCPDCRSRKREDDEDEREDY